MELRSGDLRSVELRSGLAAMRGAVRERVALAPYMHLRIGGPADWFLEPFGEEDVALAVRACRERELPLRVLGGGSNLLVSDEGVNAVVVSLRTACGGVTFDGNTVTAGAAVMLTALERAAAERGLRGLEFAVGIPGSVGGALQSNSGIGDGRCIGNVVQSV